MTNIFFSLLYGIFAGIGFSIVLYYSFRIFHELMYLLIFTLGYLLLHLLNVNWRKAKKNPLGFLKDMKTILINGIDSAFYEPTELRLGKWKWKPLFRLWKDDGEGQESRIR